MTRKQRRAVVIVVGLAMIGLASGLVLSALRTQVTFFMSPEDVEKTMPKPGTRFRLGGLVKEGSIRHEADAVTASSGGGLDEKRKTELAGLLLCLRNRFDRAAAPGSHWNVRGLRQPLGSNLVAQAAHGLAIGTDEYHSQIPAQVRESGVLRHKAPPHPRGVRARGG